MVALFIENDQNVVGGVGAIGNVDVKSWAAFLHNIFGDWAFDGGVPMLIPEAVGEKAAGLTAGLSIGKGLSLQQCEFCAILPVDANFRRRQIGIDGHRARAGNNCGRRRAGIDHDFYH